MFDGDFFCLFLYVVIKFYRLVVVWSFVYGLVWRGWWFGCVVWVISSDVRGYDII